jgi:hypothetical protein
VKTGLFSQHEEFFAMRIPLELLAVLAFLSMSCLESTNPGSRDTAAYQLPGCIRGLDKGPDSCFSYRFQDVLVAEFCASGNCCPDSNRFLIGSVIEHDTIVVIIADTAAHLCRCNCTYRLHVELADLPLSSYLFICRREDYSSQAILYSERVYREN